MAKKKLSPYVVFMNISDGFGIVADIARACEDVFQKVWNIHWRTTEQYQHDNDPKNDHRH